jgi:trimethylamine:corrinoid methyltransferase-like protein
MTNKGLLMPPENLQLIHEIAVRILAEIGIRTDPVAWKARGFSFLRSLLPAR